MHADEATHGGSGLVFGNSKNAGKLPPPMSRIMCVAIGHKFREPHPQNFGVEPRSVVKIGTNQHEVMDVGSYHGLALGPLSLHIALTGIVPVRFLVILIQHSHSPN